MAPTDQKMKSKKFNAKGDGWKGSNNNTHGVKKRKWIPENKVYQGSVKEGKFLLNTVDRCSIKVVKNSS